MALATATFQEVIEHCGIAPEVFDLEQDLDLFQGVIDRQLPFARADVRRGVGTAAYDTDDADRALQVRSAEIYRTGARLLRAILTGMALGTLPPLLMADPDVVRDLVAGLMDESDRAMQAAQMDTPTSPHAIASNTNTTSSNTAVTTPAFTRGQQF